MRWPLWRVAVAERSMEPALRPGDWLLVRRTMARGRSLRVRPGQVVVARHPGRPDMLIVKRVVALRGTHLVLRGDNADASVDSRHFGPVDRRALRGRVVYRYFPPQRRGKLRV